MGGIQRQFGALFGPTKSICAGENLLAWDSALLRLSPIRFVRQVEGECSAMWNLEKTPGSNPSDCLASLVGIFALLLSTAPCSRRNSDEELRWG
jgi:hypothetical protein